MLCAAERAESAFADGPEKFQINVTVPPRPWGLDPVALNAQQPWLRPTGRALDVARRAREATMALYARALSADGRSVDYSAVGSLPEYAEYLSAAGELQRVDLFGLTLPEKAAFFINVYNSLVIHAMVELSLPANAIDRMFFYKRAQYLIGGHAYSLDDIENGVLRGNRPGSKTIQLLSPFARSLRQRGAR